MFNLKLFDNLQFQNTKSIEIIIKINIKSQIPNYTFTFFSKKIGIASITVTNIKVPLKKLVK